MVKDMGKPGSRLILLFFGLAATAAAQGTSTVISDLQSVSVAEPYANASTNAPEPQPIDRWISRGDMELAVGFTYIRFRSSPFTANTYGLNTSFTYYLSDWIGVEGAVSSGFGSQSSSRFAAKSVLYGAGVRAFMTRREQKLRPWVHALFGGLHMFPQTAFSNNGIALVLGGGADVQLKPG